MSSSMTLARRTPPTPSKPRLARARWMAWASGSSTPGRNETSTRAFTATPPLLDHLRPLEVARAGLGQDAQAPRDLGIGLLHVAEVAPEPVLVQLLVGARIPQP